MGGVGWWVDAWWVVVRRGGGAWGMMEATRGPVEGTAGPCGPQSQFPRTDFDPEVSTKTARTHKATLVSGINIIYTYKYIYVSIFIWMLIRGSV